MSKRTLVQKENRTSQVTKSTCIVGAQREAAALHKGFSPFKLSRIRRQPGLVPRASGLTQGLEVETCRSENSVAAPHLTVKKKDTGRVAIRSQAAVYRRLR